MEQTAIVMKYFDLFGTRCTFYSEKMPKYYTLTGGIFSIISILVCILFFIIFSLDDLKRKSPITKTSYIPSIGYKNIKFGQEKIWIPWRISDYNNNEFVNHTGLLYPIIYYYSGTKDVNIKDFNLTRKKLNYKLCNETSMVNKSNIYLISIPLNELYCIEMEDLDIGGSWMTEFIKYIEFDLYYCEDGINYDESNSRCSSSNKIMNFIGDNNSLEISVYYPIVQFQPTNKTTPVIIIYRQYFYHISKYVNKIDRIFLQENQFTDDSGWILKKEYNTSYWGINSINGDTYFKGNEKDLMNEGSNSRAYSFNLYLEPGVIHYKRYYKKLFTIFSDFFPVAYIIFIIMKNISKLFKNAENNKKMIELLFENLKEKPSIFEKNIETLKISNYNNIHNIKNMNNFHNNLNNIKRLSLNSLHLFSKNGKKKIEMTKRNNNNFNSSYIKKHKYSLELQLNRKLNVNNSSILFKKNALNSINNYPGSPKKGSFVNHKKRNSFLYNNNKSNLNLLSMEYPYKGTNTIEKEKTKSKKIKQPKLKKSIHNTNLFPYKYYLFSVFVKNLHTSKESRLFSSRFVKIYTFLCQLFDITTYIFLQREFNALKKMFNDKKINLIETNKKININSNNFISDINDCIGGHKFHILAQGINC